MAKRVPYLLSLYLKQVPSHQDFAARYKDDGISYAVDSSVCIFSQSKSIEDREIGRRFAPLWEALAAKLNEIFPERHGRDFSSLLLSSVHKYSAFWIAERNGETVFQTCTTWTRTSVFILLLLVCAFLAFLMIYCDKSFVQTAIWIRTARPSCDGRTFASSPFRRLASRGPPFRGFPFFGGLWSSRSIWLDARQYTTRCLSKTLQLPARHFVLLVLYRPLAGPMTTHSDANTTV